MPSLREVAERAGVSITTASKVLNIPNGGSRFTSACRRRIREAARELGYYPNYHARSLQKGLAEMLGAVFTAGTFERPLGWYFSRVLSGVYLGARKLGQELVLIGPRDGQTALQRGVAELRQCRMDALVIPGNLLHDSDISSGLLETDAPVVVLLHDGPTSCPVLGIDQVAGAKLMVEHLTSLGHRRVLWVGPSDGRANAFAAAAWEAGLTGTTCQVGIPVVRGAKDAQATTVPAYEALRGLLREAATSPSRSAPPFSAVACYNDAMAVGVCTALRDAGLRVPADVSVIGWDDHAADCHVPPLTTIDPGLEELGRRSAKIMLDLTGGEAARARLRGFRENIQPTLVVRESTAPPPCIAAEVSSS